MSSAVDTTKLPDTSNSVLAHRLIARHYERISPVFYWLLVPFVAFIALGSGVMLSGGSVPLGIGICVAAFCIAAMGIKIEKVELPYPSLEGCDWDATTTALANSPNPIEREHVYAGHLVKSPGIPVLIPIDTLRRHSAANSGSGEGKTSLFTIPIARQIVKSRDRSVVIYNNKGIGWNKSEFHLIREEAERAGLPFYHFSLVEGRSSHVWRPFRDPALLLLPERQRTQIFSQGLGFEHGDDHGASFWTSMNKAPLARAWELYGDDINFARIAWMMNSRTEQANAGMLVKDVDRAAHLKALVESLGAIGVLNPPKDLPELEHEISALTPLTTPCVTYFDLPAIIDPDATKVVVRLHLRMLTAAARVYEGSRVECHVFCEEAQEALQRTLLTPLKQCRDTGVHLHFTFQDRSDLVNADVDFRGNMDSNTGVKVIFSARDEYGRQNLPLIGGRVVKELKSHSTTVSRGDNGTVESETTQVSEHIDDVLGPNEINELNANPNHALLVLSPREGYTQSAAPILVKMPFSVSKEERDRLDAIPWPEPVPTWTVRGCDVPKLTVEIPAPDEPPAAPSIQEVKPAPPLRKKISAPKPQQEAEAKEAAERLRTYMRQQINEHFAEGDVPQ